MSKSFYIQVRGKRQGPFTVERLRQMAKRGRFGRQYRVSSDGRSWKPADEFPDLFEAQGERKMRQTGTVDTNVHSAPSGTAPAAPSSAGWFYNHNGQQLGPVSMEILKHSQITGTLNADDLVWTHGMEEWKRADKALPGLFSGQTATAPGPNESSGDEVRGHSPVANLALYSLVLSFIPLIGSIAAVVCGHMALREIQQSHSELEGRNLAMAGLVIGYLGLLVILVFGVYYVSSGVVAMPSGSGWTPQVLPDGSPTPDVAPVN